MANILAFEGQTVGGASISSENIAFTPANSSISLDWGYFRKLSDMMMGSFGIVLENGCTAGTEISLGTIAIGLTNNIAVPVCNCYGTSEHLGNVIFYSNGNVVFTPIVTKGSTIRIAGTVVNPVVV